MTAAPPRHRCDEAALVASARAVLDNHFDVELGAVAPGSPAQVGFQHLKTADALLAAQAIAHDDFGRAAAHFRRIISHQHSDGSLPLLVYGPSVDVTKRWIDSDETFFPGPALWRNTSDSVIDSDASTGSLSADTSASSGGPGGGDAHALRLPTATLLAPPIAADVALQMYQLSPYETAMGVVGHTTDAVVFLCDVYPMLRKLHRHLFRTRQQSGSNGLLAAHHPWETFSPFSRHWEHPLSRVKASPGYEKFVAEIPSSAKARFAKGGVLEGSGGADTVKDFYEPMLFLASCYSSSSRGDSHDEFPCRLDVHDVEFNTLALRSADAFVDICRVLAARSSSCPSFDFEVSEVLYELEEATQQATSLREAIAGNDSLPSPLWNATTRIFNDDDSSTQLGSVSLRGVLPAYSIQLSEDTIAGLLSHFLSSSDTFQFFCARYPASFLPCDPTRTDQETTLLHFNYYLQRAFTKNAFPGLGMYMRNTTRDLVCMSSSGNATALAYESESGQPIGTFEDGFTGSSLASALLINILLPAVMPPPSPDALPVDHRMLTVIMCVELVVAFAVAIGCVFLSVYFVVNRPRDKRSTRAASETARARKRREARSNRSESVGALSSGNESQSSFGSSMDLEEGLLSEEEDPAYGSFNDRQAGARDGSETSGSTWQVLKDALASISPW